MYILFMNTMARSKHDENLFKLSYQRFSDNLLYIKWYKIENVQPRRYGGWKKGNMDGDFVIHGTWGKGKRVENPLITFNNIFIIHFLWGNKINQPSKNFKGD